MDSKGLEKLANSGLVKDADKVDYLLTHLPIVEGYLHTVLQNQVQIMAKLEGREVESVEDETTELLKQNVDNKYNSLYTYLAKHTK